MDWPEDRNLLFSIILQNFQFSLKAFFHQDNDFLLIGSCFNNFYFVSGQTQPSSPL